MSTMILATDLDGTFLAGDPENRQRLYQLITAHQGIKLVFVTGRGLEVVVPLLSDPAIPRPDYIICDVGATLVDGETLQPVYPVQSEINACWPGDLTIVEALKGFPGLERQEVPQQRRCSYFCEPGAVTDKLKQTIEGLGCDMLFSAGIYLDCLQRVNKGTTLQRLIEHLQLARR
ncbi:HAD family hydrolase [Nitrincola sp. A-D6]|uniref:HAD family hydrolase n=1 Tax=Nitrincola sp. A-D6 TaxID=1545442 RepID=UPI001F26C00F|nr:HAD family hydrolase [Nitrincola sp. A-D6]